MARDFVKVRDREFEAQLTQFLTNLGPIKTALNSLDLAPANARHAKQAKDAV